MQLKNVVEHAVHNCSYAHIGESPNAESVYFVFSGHRSIAKAEHGVHIKESLSEFLAPGAAITPCYVEYDSKKVPTNLLLLLGLPKIPEMVD